MQSLNLAPTANFIEIDGEKIPLPHAIGPIGLSRGVLYTYSAHSRHAIEPNSPEGQAVLRKLVKHYDDYKNLIKLESEHVSSGKLCQQGFSSI